MSRLDQLRGIFKTGVAVSIDEIMQVIDFPDKGACRTAVAVLKNPDYVKNPVDLVLIEGKDHIKRWQTRGDLW